MHKHDQNLLEGANYLMHFRTSRPAVLVPEFSIPDTEILDVVIVGQKLEGCDKVVCRFLVAVCLLVVRLDLFLLLLLLDHLPDFLLQLWRDDELVVRVRLGRGIEVAPLLPDGSIGCLLYEVLVLSLAGHRAISPSPATQSS